MTNNNNFKRIFDREPNYQNCPSGLCTGADGGFCDREGPRDTVLSGNMNAMAPIGLRTAHFSGEFRAHTHPRKFLRLKFSEMQFSAFWALNLAKAWIPY